MKSVVVMSPSPDIVFLWADDAFTDHLNKVSLAAGMIGEDYNESTVDITAALQFFSPLVASQRYMNDVNHPYCSITCANGMIIVIEQKDDYVYLVLNGDGQESEEFLKRKLRVFKYLTGFYFGPYIEHLNPKSSKLRKELWSSLSNILSTFCFLSTQQHGFLVEANEMIQVNQDVSEIAIHLLEKVVRKAQREGDPQAKHAMLLVNCKVLALYSSSNQTRKLQGPDIMMLTTLVRSRFPHPELSIPLSVNRTPSPLTYEAIKFQDVHIKPSSSKTELEELEEDLMESKVPYGEVRSTSVDIKIDGVNSHKPELQDSCYYPSYSTLDEEGLVTDGQSSEQSDQYSKNASSDSEKYYTPDEEYAKYLSDCYDGSNFAGKSNRSSQKTESSSASISDPENELYRQRIFLRPYRSIYIPHTVHCLQVSPGTVLVIISEVKKGDLAVDMCSLIAILSDFIDEKPEMQEAVNHAAIIERIEQHIRRITEGLKGKTAAEKSFEVHLTKIWERWEDVKTHNIQGYLQNRSKQRLSPILERALVDMVRSLTTLFDVVYCAGKTFHGPAISMHHAKALYSIQETVQKEMKDYASFVLVKSERNVTMTAYLEEFPGLVHFIYVDRTANRVVAPSINSDSKEIYNPQDSAHFMKQTIWDGWNYVQAFLREGHTNVFVRYGDFLFSYILWFEDPSGNEKLVMDPNAFAEDFPESPGVVGSDFYSELKRRCFPSLPQEKIYCYELLCVHIGIIPLSQVSGHSRRLAAMLWESSGEANLPMFLVG